MHPVSWLKLQFVTLLILLVFGVLFFAPSCASAATNVFYSVGQNTTDHKTGTPTVTISGTTATFSVAQTATNMGVGDKVTWGNVGVGYITGKTSTTVWSISTATGGTPTATTSAPVNSIAHAFASLNAAVGNGVSNNATSSSFLNTSNLVSGDYTLNIPLYFDTATDTAAVIISGYTTGPNNYIKLYTPISTTTEANTSQRHNGVWNDTKFKIARTFSSVLTINSNYVIIEGLQFSVTPNGSHRSIEITGLSGAGNIKISKSIFRGIGLSFNRSGYIYFSSSSSIKVDIYNNLFDRATGGTSANAASIVYDSGVTTESFFVYNNTFANNYVGILHYTTPGGSAGVVAKNNLFTGSVSADTIGTFGTSTNYNATSRASLGYTVTGGGNGNDRVNQTFVFSDSGNTDYRLTETDSAAKDNGIDLSADLKLSFSDDIIATVRPLGAGWNIGAFEYEVPVQPPNRSNKSPSGVLVTGTTQTTLSLDTDIAATCRYSNTTGVAYASMVNDFTSTGGVSHSTSITGLQDDQLYTYYVRCFGNGAPNTDDYEITFWVGKATYHVNNSGSPGCSDSYSGTTLKPWCTIQKSADTMLSGDTTIVEPGSYAEKVTTVADGTPSRPITFQASTTAAIAGAFTIDNQYQIIDGFSITGNSATSNQGSVYVINGGTHATIRNNIFDGSPVNVYQFLLSTTNDNATSTIISGNQFNNGKSHAITLVGGTDHVVSSNTLTSIYGGDVFRIQSSDTTISNNTVSSWSNPILSNGDSLVVGKSYYFLDVSGSPDFSNVGAGVGPYQVGEAYAWTATATTPTSWGSAQVQGSNHPDLIQSFAYNDNEFAQNVIIKNNRFLNASETQIGNIEDQTGLGNVSQWIWYNNIFSNVQYVMSIYASDFYFFNNVFYKSGTNSGHPLVFAITSTRIPFTTAGVSVAANTITPATSLDFVTGDQIKFYNTPPSPLSTSGSFFARVISGSTFTVHPTALDATNNTNVIDLTTTGSDAIAMGVSKSSAKGSGHNGKVFNNIFVEDGSDPATDSRGWYGSAVGITGLTADYNLVLGTGAGTTKVGFQTAGLETNGINGSNPLFVSTSTNDFTLQVGSPAINEGTDLSAYFTTDFASTTRPQGPAWDIGAYEYVGVNIPTITTQSASSVTATTATLNGNITATGGSNATTRGFAYSTSATLATVIATTSASGSFSTGAYTDSVSSLTCNTAYYARAYATNSGGTGYGSIQSFTTSACPDTTPPVLSAGVPSGTLSAGTTGTTLSVTTDESATCKYGTLAATAYASISNTFSTTGGTTHTQSLSGLSAGSYSYYVRCTDGSSNANTSDYTLAFTIAAPVTADSVPESHANLSSANRARRLSATPNQSVPTSSSSGTPTLRQFIDVLTALGIIPPDKAEIAREAIQAQNTATVPQNNLATGYRGSSVQALQRILNAKGFLVAKSGAGSPGNETSVFGAGTREALRAFQQANGIPATGYYGPLTRAALAESF